MSIIVDRQERAAIVAVGTWSRKQNNQDAAGVVCHPELPVSGVIVADGLGSHFGADVAAHEATAALARSIEAAPSLESLVMPVLFEHARDAIAKVVDRHGSVPGGLNLDDAFGTTLLCGLDLPERLLMAYVGNGSLIHLRANFVELPPTLLMPWSAVNCLNPHSQMVDGIGLLYKWLGPRTSAVQSAPSAIELTKDNHGCGDILIVGSDGLCSLDHAQAGPDARNQLWHSADWSIAVLYEHLRTFFSDGLLTSAGLRDALENYLGDLAARHPISDDCTVAVVVTGAALRYYESRRSQGRRGAA